MIIVTRNITISFHLKQPMSDTHTHIQPQDCQSADHVLLLVFRTMIHSLNYNLFGFVRALSAMSYIKSKLCYFPFTSRFLYLPFLRYCVAFFFLNMERSVPPSGCFFLPHLSHCLDRFYSNFLSFGFENRNLFIYCLNLCTILIEFLSKTNRIENAAREKL